MSEEPSGSDAVMRISRFRPRPKWDSVDPALREAIPTFLAQPALLGAWIGRRTMDVGEQRAIVSVWKSASSESRGLRIPDMLPADLGIETADRFLLPVAFFLQFPREAAAAILRIYHGTTLPGQLDLYVEEARRGSAHDGERPDGPLAISMSLDRPDGFITASVWTDWACIEACTGGNVHMPLVSRSRDRLAAGGPIHYEIVASS